MLLIIGSQDAQARREGDGSLMEQFRPVTSTGVVYG
jgi:hypothetical protein